MRFDIEFSRRYAKLSSLYKKIHSTVNLGVQAAEDNICALPGCQIGPILTYTYQKKYKKIDC